MREFFGMEGAFNKYGGMVADMVLVSFMWILFCLPIVTVGASTSALFYVTTRRIANREGYITTDFWEAFKTNFKRATILWMIAAVLLLILMVNFLFLTADGAEAGGIFALVLPAQLVFLFVIAIMNVYVYPLIARFDMGLLQIIKSAFYLSVRHFLTSITCVVMAVIAVSAVLFMFPPLLLIAPGLYAWMASILIMKIFKRYRPEMDKDPVLEIAEIEAQKAAERRRSTGENEETITEDTGELVTNAVKNVAKGNEETLTEDTGDSFDDGE
jgi:uncharacterized membrane protein YesL